MSRFTFRNIFLAFIVCNTFSCSTTPKLKKVETSMIELNSQSVQNDAAFEMTINPYKIKMDLTMNDVLIVSEQPLTKGSPESTLGDFTADALLIKTNDHYKPADKVPGDISFLNNGSMRTAFPKGDITRGNAFGLMPFENFIVVLTISGAKTKQLFEYIVENNGFPFAGARVKVKERKITELKINGKNLDLKKTYKIITSDYILGETIKYYFFKDPIKSEVLKYKLRDAIIDYLVDENKKGHSLKVNLDERIKYE